MINVNIDFLGFLKFAAAAIDLSLTAKTVSIFLPLFTAFFLIANAVSERKGHLKTGLIIVYLLVSAAYFAIGAGDALGENKTFRSIAGAGIAGIAMFAFFTFVMLAISVALKPLDKKQKKYVATISETPFTERKNVKAYPLKSNVFSYKNTDSRVNYAEFEKFLQKIESKELSFSDKIEYNRINLKANFLRGVALTENTTCDFCEIFGDSVKLAAKYDIE